MFVGEYHLLDVRHVQQGVAVLDAQLFDQVGQQDLTLAGDAVVHAVVVEIDGILDHVIGEAVGREGEALQQVPLAVEFGVHLFGFAVFDVVQLEDRAVRLGALPARQQVDGRGKAHRHHVAVGVLVFFVGQADVKGRVAGDGAALGVLRRGGHARGPLCAGPVRLVDETYQPVQRARRQRVDGDVRVRQRDGVQGRCVGGRFDGLFDGDLFRPSLRLVHLPHRGRLFCTLFRGLFGYRLLCRFLAGDLIRQRFRAATFPIGGRLFCGLLRGILGGLLGYRLLCRFLAGDLIRQRFRAATFPIGGRLFCGLLDRLLDNLCRYVIRHRILRLLLWGSWLSVS